MTVCMYRDIHTLQPYIIDFTQRGCHTLRLASFFFLARIGKGYFVKTTRICFLLIRPE